MGGKCILIDTSILLELLNVPYMAKQSEQIWASFDKMEKSGGIFYIPLATIIETGNHIAQNGDGRERRRCAQEFVGFITNVLNSKSPFKYLSFLTKEDLQGWIDEFPEYAMRNDSKGKGMGIGDLSIIKDMEKLHQQYPTADIIVWSLDGHLDSYNIKGKG